MKATTIKAGLFALALAVGGQQASAALVSVDPDGSAGSESAVNVATLDWTPGNVLAKNGIGAINTFIGTGDSVGGGGFTLFTGGVQETIDVYYQASLSNFLGDAGLPITGLDLNTDYEWTILLHLQERVTSVVTGPTSAEANFELVPGSSSYMKIFRDAPGDADPLTGEGYNNGELILDGHVANLQVSDFERNTGQASQLFDQFGTDNYGGQQSVTGGGTTVLVGQVDWFDPDTFNLPPGIVLDLSFLNTSIIVPFNQTNPSQKFWDADLNAYVTPLLGDLNGGNGLNDGPDFQFQADANQSFTIIPEPATAALGLMSLGFLAAGIRRRR